MRHKIARATTYLCSSALVWENSVANPSTVCRQPCVHTPKGGCTPTLRVPRNLIARERVSRHPPSRDTARSPSVLYAFVYNCKHAYLLKQPPLRRALLLMLLLANQPEHRKPQLRSERSGARRDARTDDGCDVERPRDKKKIAGAQQGRESIAKKKKKSQPRTELEVLQTPQCGELCPGLTWLLGPRLLGTQRQCV